MKNHNKAFGKILRSLRKDRGYTQETLAFESGLDRTYVSLLELGSRSPTLDTIMTLCSALNVTLSQFMQAVETEMQRHQP
jgi:transcriptional regulator with XRE-family HTH domain